MRDKLSAYEGDIDLDFGFPEYDPLSVLDEVGDQVPDPSTFVVDPVGAAERAPEEDAPASERIARLFDAMKARRRVLMAILRHAAEPRTPEELAQFVNELQEHDFSVYGAADYTRQLERAGALRKVDQDGEPFGPEHRREPEVIVGPDGERYYKPAESPALFWLTTDEGAAFLSEDDPLARLEGMLVADAGLAPLYRAIVELCDADEGCAPAVISERIDGDALVQEPRRYSSYFTERLERCDALVWKGAWFTTPIGRAALEQGVFDC